MVDYVNVEDAGTAHGSAGQAWWQQTATDAVSITYRLVLTDGDELFSAIEKFCAQEKVTYADFSGIGAVRDVQLGWFDRQRRKYRVNAFPGQFEALGIIGNVGLNSETGKPAAHTHLAVAGEDGTTHAGHLLSVTASPTIELNVVVIPGERLSKSTDEASGLSLYDR
ncbi:hypothetical protein ATK17_2502 [Branchiibius hedensis]|uniref:PPC domain-containing protein n=1 Tax=Branchiibius hedensis TaxID=672460 RepID=A0A2Y8ZZ19_9MICO|nr:hypothetical protein ATK17_2502 [Branchiibius hedensis]SSA35157.1 hypothetical protein SAMN04489750_2502 [Branchiibius hedensis]